VKLYRELFTKGLFDKLPEPESPWNLWFDETSGFTGYEEEVSHAAFMAGWDAAIAKYEAKHNDDIYGKKVEK
jgi:hypothetical protein